MASNPKSVQRLIASLGLEQSRTAALRKDWWLYMESTLVTKQAAVERLHSDPIRQIYVNEFLESAAGEKWFKEDGGLCIEHKPMPVLRIGLLHLVKQWMTNFKNNEGKPQRDDGQNSSEAAREVRRLEKKRQRKSTSDRTANNISVYSVSDDEDYQEPRRRLKPSSSIDKGHRSRHGSPELPDPSEFANQAPKPRSSSSIWSPQISPDPATGLQTSSSQIRNKIPNSSEATTGISVKNTSNVNDLPTPPTSDHKRKRSTALDLVDAQGPSEEPGNTDKMVKKRARFAAPVVMPSDRSDFSTNMAAETGTDEVISAYMSGALPMVETDRLQTAAPLPPMAGPNDPIPDEQRTVSDATDMTMDEIHVPLSMKSGGDSIRMSLESLRRVPAQLLDYIQETESYHSNKANDRDAGRPDRERHKIREKLMYELKKDLTSIVLSGQGGKQDDAGRYTWAQSY